METKIVFYFSLQKEELVVSGEVRYFYSEQNFQPYY